MPPILSPRAPDPLNKMSPSSPVVESFFRHEYGKTVSYLVGRFGSDKIGEIEDAVQDSLLIAMRTWPLQGTPNSPAAWILRSSTNKLIDGFRRAKNFDSKREVFKRESALSEEANDSEKFFKDDLLRMMFACCHPSMKLESQVILILKILCGFGISEISSALFKKEEAVRKAYTRSKKQLADLGIGKSDEAVDETRLNSVLQVIYLLFNEGYSSSSGENLTRPDLCLEAMRLGTRLLTHESLCTQDTHALLALFSYLASRFDTRTDEDGSLVPLDRQDRSRWDKELIRQGDYLLSISTSSEVITRYQIEAGIAALHSNAKSIEHVDWRHIVTMYNALVKRVPGPATKVNRAVALSRVEGPATALASLEDIADEKGVQSYYLFHAVKADLLAQLGRKEEARGCIETAVLLTENETEKRFLRGKIL